MGGNCSTHEGPQLVNDCHVPLGGGKRLDGFCTLSGPAGDGYRDTWCSRMSQSDEWENGGESGSCAYSDSHPYIDYGYGCCHVTCGISGSGVNCRRKAYTGNPLQCCMKDYACHNEGGPTPASCYSDPNKQHTCDPKFRSLTEGKCPEVMSSYCTGQLPTDAPGSTEWLTRWDDTCPKYIYRLLSNEPCKDPIIDDSPGCGRGALFPDGINADGYVKAQALVKSALKRYEEIGFKLGTIAGYKGYNEWQETFYKKVGCPFPGLIQDALKQDICSGKSAEQISKNPALVKWCGCHLPDDEYEVYSELYNIPPQCSPLCNRRDTIPIISVGDKPVLCEQNVCIMDQTVVNIIDSTIGGGVDFDQICGSCPEGSICSCVASSNEIDIESSTIGGNFVPIAQRCGASLCLKDNPSSIGPRKISVPCSEKGSYDPFAQHEQDIKDQKIKDVKESWKKTLIAISVIIVIIILIWYFIAPEPVTGKGRTIHRKDNTIKDFIDKPEPDHIESLPADDFVSILDR